MLLPRTCGLCLGQEIEPQGRSLKHARLRVSQKIPQRSPREGAPDCGEPAQKGDVPRRIGRTTGGLNSKVHAVCDGAGKPIILLLSEGQMSDHKGARFVVEALPSRSTLIADRGYDSNWFREALADKDITSCIPPTKSRKVPIAYGEMLYRQRHKVENMFAKQGLAPDRHPVGSLRSHLLLSHLHRGSRCRLPQLTSPEHR